MTKDAWQTFGLVVLTAVVAGGVGGLFINWPPEPPRAALAPAAQQAPDPTPEPPVAVFLGDSYTAGSGASSPPHSWTSIVAKEMGWQEVNFGEGGTGYSTAGTVADPTSYSDRVDNIAAEVVWSRAGRTTWVGPPT